MTDKREQEREAFEAWASAPPYERSVERSSDDPEQSAWPGQYIDFGVEFAWQAWAARSSPTPTKEQSR